MLKEKLGNGEWVGLKGGVVIGKRMERHGERKEWERCKRINEGMGKGI